MNLPGKWEAFGSEDLSKPEVRANVALGHAFSSPILGLWLRGRLKLPPDALIFSARHRGIPHRPDLAVFVAGQLAAVIECELGGRAEGQGLNFANLFGVPVLWVVGKRKEPEDLLWEEICTEALLVANIAPPLQQGTLLTLAAVIRASLGKMKKTRVKCAPPEVFRTPAWYNGAFVPLFGLIEAGKLVNLPWVESSLSIRLLASPPVKPGTKEGISLLSLTGNPRFVTLIGPAKLRSYLMGATGWITTYEAALSAIVPDWSRRIDSSGMLLMSDMEIAPKAALLRRAYEAFALEAGQSHTVLG